MSDYFISDIHLRGDRPERARRLSRFLNRLNSNDRLVIAGDLCDFWMASRQSADELSRDEGIRALTVFREAGGNLSILPGNHDLWLCPFYEKALGAAILTEPAKFDIHGQRVHVVHGHLLGARRKWKAFLESREFFQGFGRTPYPMARLLDVVLEKKNERGLADDERRHLVVYREYAAGLRDEADIVVFGHVHRAIDEPGPPRLIVLGGWQARSSYLKIDATGASFHIEGDEPDADSSSPGRSSPTSSPSSRASL